MIIILLYARLLGEIDKEGCRNVIYARLLGGIDKEGCRRVCQLWVKGEGEKIQVFTTSMDSHYVYRVKIYYDENFDSIHMQFFCL